MLSQSLVYTSSYDTSGYVFLWKHCPHLSHSVDSIDARQQHMPLAYNDIILLDITIDL